MELHSNVCLEALVQTAIQRKSSQIQNTYVPVSTKDDKPDELDAAENVLLPFPFLPRRYIVCILLFSGLFILYSLRVNLSVAVVVMTNNRQVSFENGTTVPMKEFNWNSKEKGFILSSFFYGFMISEIPGGWLAGRFGGATVLGVEMLLSSLFTFLIPFVAPYGPWAIFFFRAMIGIFEGGSTPCMQAIWSRWAPIREKTVLITASFIGAKMANGICFSVYGWLAVTWGWPFLFYVPAFIGLLWCVLWFIYVKNDPCDDSRITESELKYIQSTVGQKSEDQVIYPWKSLLASVPMWTIAIAYFCRTWGYSFYSSELPSYFNDVWKMNVKDSGILISIPYFVVPIISISSALLSDYIVANTKYSVTWVRKLFHTAGELGAAVCFFLVGYSTSSTMALILITISNCFYSVSFCAIYAGALDIAPRFASVVMGIITTVASIASIIVPIVTGYVVVNENKEEWLLAYLICGGVITAGTIIYLLFASGEIQPWARTNAEDNSEV